MKTYKIVFAGTPQFAVDALQSLLKTPHHVVAVYTQPDKPAGRGQQMTASPVKRFALDQGIPVYQPQTLKTADAQELLSKHKADLMVVAAYGLILPKDVLTLFPLGCINIHASLLPRWRGAAPIQRAILAGDSETGITIMQMDEGLDTGAMLYKLTCNITPFDTAQSLHDKLAVLGGQSLVHALSHLDQLKPESQDNTLATYASKLTKNEAKINWQDSAEHIERQIRALNPWPGCFTFSEGNLVKLWQADVISKTSNAKPGTIVAFDKEGLCVSTGNGLLQIKKAQFAGSKPISSIELFNANKSFLKTGSVFDE